MIFVFTTVLAFFTMLFWYADKMNREAERQQVKRTSTKQVFQNIA